jgi:S1-C subfamily serine protease/tellurite resistance protein
MKSAEVVFNNLICVARADGKTEEVEKRLIEEYRHALGLGLREARAIGRRKNLRLIGPKEGEVSTGESVAHLRMLIRVASADGEMERGERRLIEKVAESLGVGPLELADLMVAIGGDATTRQRVKLAKVLVGCVALMAVGLAIWAATAGEKKAETTEHRIVSLLADTKDELGRQADEADRKAAAAVEATQKEWEEREKRTQQALKRLSQGVQASGSKAEEFRKLRAEIQKLEASGSSGPEVRGELQRLRKKLEEQSGSDVAFSETKHEIDGLRRELAQIRGANSGFQAAIADYGHSVLIIYCEYRLEKEGETRRRSSSGTGFVVSPDGLIVTNKHVAKPWLFDGETRRLEAQGWKRDDNSWFICAWPAGTRVLDEKRRYRFNSGLATHNQKLAFHGATPDAMTVRKAKDQRGLSIKGRFHELDCSDLAILKAEFPDLVPALPLETNRDLIQQLDPVMVLGFPKGFSLIEGDEAMTSPSLGEVRKIDRSLWVTAPIVGGNSGGPIIDGRGRVIAVAYKGYGDIETVAAGIPSEHILPLLPNGAALRAEAEREFRRQHWRAARDFLRLAEQRGAPVESCEDLRARLRTQREAAEREHRELLRAGETDKARALSARMRHDFGKF